MMPKTRHYSTNVIKILIHILYVFEVFKKDTLT